MCSLVSVEIDTGSGSSHHRKVLCVTGEDALSDVVLALAAEREVEPVLQRLVHVALRGQRQHHVGQGVLASHAQDLTVVR